MSSSALQRIKQHDAARPLTGVLLCISRDGFKRVAVEMSMKARFQTMRAILVLALSVLCLTACLHDKPPKPEASLQDVVALI